MKITELPSVSTLDDDQVLIVDGGEAGKPTSKITVADAAKKFGENSGNIIENEDEQWVYHRNTYRGKYLGNVYTDEQKEAVRTGTFDDLYIGDYWTINDVDWMIADINYWFGTGNNATQEKVTTPHLVIIPKGSLYLAKMNDTATTNGGYVGSKMYTNYLNNAKSTIYNCFGEDNILNHIDVFVNSINNSDGLPNGVVYVNSKVDLMNQLMVIGSMPFNNYINTATSQATPILDTMDKVQLSLFRLRPELMAYSNIGYWTRDTVTTKSFVIISYLGVLKFYTAENQMGVRPVFGLIGN